MRFGNGPGGLAAPEPRRPFLLRVTVGRSRIVAVVAAAAVVTTGGVVISNRSDPTPPPAASPTPTPSPDANNLWQQDGGGSCVRSSTPVTFANRNVGGDHLCEDSNTAYAAANGGDTVGLKEPVATVFIHNQTTKGSNTSRVTFRPDAGDTIAVDDLDIQNNDNITVQDVDFNCPPCTGGWGIKQADNITYLRVTSTGADSGGGINGDTNNILIKDCDVGPIDPEDGIQLNGQFGNNNNVTIDGCTFHDLTRISDPGAHDDCIQTGNVSGLTIKNSRFINCAVEGLFINRFGAGDVLDNVLVENNMFGNPSDGSYILRIPGPSGSCTGCDGPADVTVRYNSFVGTISIDGTTPNDRWYGNIITGNNSGECAGIAGSATEFAYNVTSVSCTGATNNTLDSGAASQWVSTTQTSAAFNLHLNAGATAIGKGKPGSAPTEFPLTDFDGDIRTSPPDAGADQR